MTYDFPNIHFTYYLAIAQSRMSAASKLSVISDALDRGELSQKEALMLLDMPEVKTPINAPGGLA